jgi:hypothetical protein
MIAFLNSLILSPIDFASFGSLVAPNNKTIAKTINNISVNSHFTHNVSFYYRNLFLIKNKLPLIIFLRPKRKYATININTISPKPIPIIISS